MKLGILVSTALVAALGGCVSIGQIPTAKLASATLHQANGAPAGTAIVTAAGDKLSIWRYYTKRTQAC